MYYSKSILNSLNNSQSSVNELDEIVDWVQRISNDTKVSCTPIPLTKLNQWNFDCEKILHNSGKFFSIRGLEVRCIYNEKKINWSQPIIDQPEFKFLGIICRNFDLL